jgi:hypothetical protein
VEGTVGVANVSVAVAVEGIDVGVDVIEGVNVIVGIMVNVGVSIIWITGKAIVDDGTWDAVGRLEIGFLAITAGNIPRFCNIDPPKRPRLPRRINPNRKRVKFFVFRLDSVSLE